MSMFTSDEWQVTIIVCWMQFLRKKKNRTRHDFKSLLLVLFDKVQKKADCCDENMNWLLKCNTGAWKVAAEPIP